MSNELTTIERVKLENYEEIIGRGMQTFVDVGRSLAAIRDGRLYREQYPNFEAYSQGKWRFTKSRANQLIEAAEVTERIDNNCCQESPILPSNEGQAREVAKAPKDKQAKVWSEAVATAPRDEKDKPKITARHVEETRERIVNGPRTGKIIPVPEEPELSDAEIAEKAMGERNAILKDFSRQIGSLLKELPEMAMLRRDQIVANVKLIQMMVREALAECVCPKCQGARCGTCLNTGFITKPKKQELAE